ncbi:hypothetical protein ABH37_00785 [Mycobacterium haemophilum]|uniref:Uncharacterized protein n=1 Tax=Mycobacterium haemophilum TaxID=29311 RepID=A0A0I9YYQ2_9MYCO|nr:hypothetical protein ABH39_00785 [Mycobacterium haemophilum]KLO39250.1 hypothetical protein ABH38_00785 [Mycobacterium haemophilum]KLO45557.1 hypothetical protein ABH37_00785 [Mycobacterium haemophilum]KLO56708.1 hypothetical protein ABH36_00785 [Mycobacterium haemophilum]
MTRRFDLERDSREFAQELTDLLNATVCDGIRLTTVISPGRDRARAVIGYEISKQELDLRRCIAVTIGADPKIWLGFSMRLEQDFEDKYLMVRQSVMLLSASADPANTLLHYDYERDKPDDYPDAHLQICATSEAWKQVGVRTDGSERLLERMHLPVGGRRFRPTLEDIVEFLIAEKLAQPKDGWKQAITEGRERFRRKQLSAAIRRDRETARAVLAQFDTEAES